MQFGAENVFCALLQGEALVGRKILVKLTQDFDTPVGGLSFHGVVPGIEQYLLAFLFLFSQPLSHRQGLVVSWVFLYQPFNLLAGIGPLMVF